MGFVLGICVSQVAGLVLVDVGEGLQEQDLGILVGGFAVELIDGETHQAVGVVGRGNVVDRGQLDGTGQMGVVVGVVGVVMVVDGDVMAIGAAMVVVLVAAYLMEAFALVAVAGRLLVFGETLIVGLIKIAVQVVGTDRVFDQESVVHVVVDHEIGDHEGSGMVLVVVEVLVARVEDQDLAIADLIQFQTVVGRLVVLIGRVVGFSVVMAVFLAVLVAATGSVIAGAVEQVVIFVMVVFAAMVADLQVLVGVTLWAVESS